MHRRNFLFALISLFFSSVSFANSPAITVPHWVIEQINAQCEWPYTDSKYFAQDSYVIPASEGDNSATVSIGNGQILYFIPCGGGAYNPQAVAFLESGKDWIQLYFVEKQEKGLTSTPYIFHPKYTDHTIINWIKYLGDGRCGMVTRYALHPVKADSTLVEKHEENQANLMDIWEQPTCDSRLTLFDPKHLSNGKQIYPLESK